MLQTIYNETVTVLNKLKRVDNDNHTDAWYKFVLTNVAWYTDSSRSATATDKGGIFIGTYNKILIPFNEFYVPYSKWKTMQDRGSFFTMSDNDYIIKGIIPDDITAETVVHTLEKYGEDVCLVRHHKELHDRFNARVQLKIEGV